MLFHFPSYKAIFAFHEKTTLCFVFSVCTIYEILQCNSVNALGPHILCYKCYKAFSLEF